MGCMTLCIGIVPQVSSLLSQCLQRVQPLHICQRGLVLESLLLSWTRCLCGWTWRKYLWHQIYWCIVWWKIWYLSCCVLCISWCHGIDKDGISWVGMGVHRQRINRCWCCMLGVSVGQVTVCVPKWPVKIVEFTFKWYCPVGLEQGVHIYQILHWCCRQWACNYLSVF